MWEQSEFPIWVGFPGAVTNNNEEKIRHAARLKNGQTSTKIRLFTHISFFSTRSSLSAQSCFLHHAAFVCRSPERKKSYSAFGRSGFKTGLAKSPSKLGKIGRFRNQSPPNALLDRIRKGKSHGGECAFALVSPPRTSIHARYATSVSLCQPAAMAKSARLSTRLQQT